MLFPLSKLPSNLDLVEARLLQHGPSGPEIDRPDPSLPAEPKKPATAEDTKLDPEAIGFDPSFGEYDSDGHSSLDKYLSGSLFGNFIKWITSELWPQLEKYLGKGYDKLILQNLPPDRVNAHRDGQPSENAPAAAMTPAEKANSEGLSYDQHVFLGTNLPNENGQQLSADNTLLLKEFASFRESLEAKTPAEIGVMHDQITKHLSSLLAFVDKPEEEEQASLAYVQKKAEFYKDLKVEIDKGDIGSQVVLAKRLEVFNGANEITPLLTEQGNTLQTIIDAKNADATAPLGNKSALLLANYWLEQDFLLLNTLVPENAEPEKLSANGTLEEFIVAEYTDAAFNQFLQLNYQQLLAIVDKDSSGTDSDKNKAYIGQLSVLIYDAINKYPLPSEADFEKTIADLRKDEPNLGSEFKEIVDVIFRGAKLKLVKKRAEQEAEQDKAEQNALAEKEKVVLADLITGKLDMPKRGESWDPLGVKKLLRRSQDLFEYRHELHRHIIDNGKKINSSYLLANELITEAEYQKLWEIDSNVTNLVNAIFKKGFGIPEESSPLLNQYRNEITTKLSSGLPLADERVRAYYEQVLNYLDYAQAYVDRQPRVLFGKEFLGILNGNESSYNSIDIQNNAQTFEYIDHLGAKRSVELVEGDNGAFKLTLGTVTYTIAIKDKKQGIGDLYLRVDNDPATGVTWIGLDYDRSNGDKIEGNAFYLNEFIRVNGAVEGVASNYQDNFGNYEITSDKPAEKPEVTQLNEDEGERIIDLIEDQNFDFPVGSETHDIEIDNAEYEDDKVVFDLVIDDSFALNLDLKFGTGTIKKQNDGKFLLSVKAFGGEGIAVVDSLETKNDDGVSDFISKSLEVVSALRLQEWKDPDTWFKESNFNYQTTIQGGYSDKFEQLTLDKNKNTWTIELEKGNEIVVNQVNNVDNNLYLVAGKTVNGKTISVVGKITWPTDIYGHIDRTEALKNAVNRLINDF